MCQLTYSNLYDPFLNASMVYFLGSLGSEEKHDDGCGFMCGDSIWRSELPANKITNLGTILNDLIKDDKPVPFHIRWASYGIAVTKENAHPFIGKHYILMHNGTLLPKNGQEPKNKDVDSDSLRFLLSLDEQKDKKPKANFQDIFNEAMKNFAGKFAFIIREIGSGADYIVRGRTAELWISKIEIDGRPNGYIINTSRETLKKAIHEFININSLVDGRKYNYSEPILLGAERIFLAKKNDLKEIGKAVEHTPVKAEVLTPKAALPAKASSGTNSTKKFQDYHDADTNEIMRLSKDIFEYLRGHCMSLVDIQFLLMEMSGLSILELTKQDLKIFVDYIIPKISAEKRLRAEVNRILKGQDFPFNLYKEANLKYPWPVNESKVVLEALENYFQSNSVSQ